MATPISEIPDQFKSENNEKALTLFPVPEVIANKRAFGRELPKCICIHPVVEGVLHCPGHVCNQLRSEVRYIAIGKSDDFLRIVIETHRDFGNDL